VLQFIHMNQQQYEKIKHGKGFIAALDQSGGSTPKALKGYGINEDAYNSDAEMFDLVHAMRTRIMTAPSFTGERILGTILFKDTLEREVLGKPTADYVWEERGIVPFLKVDSGLMEQAQGVSLMKPIPDFEQLLDRAVEKNVFGTKMRSVIYEYNLEGIQAIVDQQFEFAQQIIAKGLVPILEPEVDIHAEQKADIEQALAQALLERLNQLHEDEIVMIKLTIPDIKNVYADLALHKNVARVVALSGGYTQSEADARLQENNNDGVFENNMIASFSRALLEGLSADQSDEAFNTKLENSIERIYQASIA
jgi:fructose-bisphosphate aldolase class I